MFGGLRSKLKKWHEAGLITETQSSEIYTFEQKRKQGKLVKDLTNVGVIAILIGFISLVAANWHAIPVPVRLIGHFVLNAGLATFMLRLDETKNQVAKDACILGLFGLFLTFIALIGQTYQLHGELHLTLLFWLLICTPFIWVYGRTYTVIAPWLAVAVTTLYWNIGVLFEDTPNRLLLLGSLLSLYLPPALLLFSKLRWIESFRPGFVWTFRKLGLYLPAIFANIAILLFYDSTRTVEYPIIQLALFAAGLLGIFIIFKPKNENDQQGFDLWYYLLFSGIIMMLPFGFPGVESEFLSAALFILYWAFLAWLGARINADNLSNWAIRFIILRLFIVYLEVFGSMLMTGFGLIISGVILLVILRKLNTIVAFGNKLVKYEIKI
jgi:uncharacterized membrane protein